MAKKEKQLKDKGKFEELVKSLLSGKLSTRELSSELKEIFAKDEKKDMTLDTVMKHFEKVVKELEDIEASTKIVDDARKVLKKLQKSIS